MYKCIVISTDNQKQFKSSGRNSTKQDGHDIQQRSRCGSQPDRYIVLNQLRVWRKSTIPTAKQKNWFVSCNRWIILGEHIKLWFCVHAQWFAFKNGEGDVMRRISFLMLCFRSYFTINLTLSKKVFFMNILDKNLFWK